VWAVADMQALGLNAMKSRTSLRLLIYEYTLLLLITSLFYI